MSASLCAGRMRFLAKALCAMAAFFAIACTSAGAEIVRVEEDWELVVASTDAASTAPQVTTAMSPTGSVSGLHATFELNHQSTPDFIPGGLHLLIWDGEEPGEGRKFPNPSTMDSGQEVVRWTQRMRLDGNSLVYSIRNGTSTTWGDFGGQGYLRTSVGTSLMNLNGYSPAASVEHSGVTYAGNRVAKLALKRVRAYTANGDVQIDETERIVHQN